MQLSPTEYSLLVTLVERAGQPMTFQQINEQSTRATKDSTTSSISTGPQVALIDRLGKAANGR